MMLELETLVRPAPLSLSSDEDDEEDKDDEEDEGDEE